MRLEAFSEPIEAFGRLPGIFSLTAYVICCIRQLNEIINFLLHSQYSVLKFNVHHLIQKLN